MREDVEYLLCFIRVLPGSLSDISFRTACGLSVPANKPCFKPSEPFGTKHEGRRFKSHATIYGEMRYEFYVNNKVCVM